MTERIEYRIKSKTRELGFELVGIARATEAEADIQARLAESLVELDARQEFNYRVRNDDLDTATAEMARIVDAVTRSV